MTMLILVQHSGEKQVCPQFHILDEVNAFTLHFKYFGGMQKIHIHHRNKESTFMCCGWRFAHNEKFAINIHIPLHCFANRVPRLRNFVIKGFDHIQAFLLESNPFCKTNPKSLSTVATPKYGKTATDQRASLDSFLPITSVTFDPRTLSPFMSYRK